MTIDPQNLPNDLSILAIKILCFLADHGESNVTAVGKSFAHSNITTACISASGHLFKLEKAGLVKRIRSAEDRRQSLFALTAKGQRLVNSWQPESLVAAA